MPSPCRAGGSSGESYLRKGKNVFAKAEGEKKKKVRNSSINTKVREQEGRAGAPGAGAGIHLQPVKNLWVYKIVSLLTSQSD